MNFERYPWLHDLNSKEAQIEIEKARRQFQSTGALTLANFLTDDALHQCVQDCRAQEDDAFTTDDTHTVYLKSPDTNKFPANSVYNHEMRTQVASTAFDELPNHSVLAVLYRNPTLLQLVSSIVGKRLYLSEDPLGCCSINVFRPGYYHSFHFDESEFSTTLMLQQAQQIDSGLFQYTDPLRQDSNDLVLSKAAAVIHQYDNESLPYGKVLAEWCGQEEYNNNNNQDPSSITTANSPTDAAAVVPRLLTLDFSPGTLSIFSGSRSLHRVTRVHGNQSRLVAVLTFATVPGFQNSPQVQQLFWGRSSLSLSSPQN